MRFNPLPFEFLQIFDLDVAQVAVDVDDDGDGHGRFRSADADGEQGEEEALQLTRKQKTVEYHEIDIYRIEDQFHRDQHRQQVAARDEPVDSHEHHDRRNDQVILHVYHSSNLFCTLSIDRIALPLPSCTTFRCFLAPPCPAPPPEEPLYGKMDECGRSLFLLFLVPFYYRLRAIRIPPTMQASSNKLMTSNGSR
jgi:hypothetical protein